MPLCLGSIRHWAGICSDSAERLMLDCDRQHCIYCMSLMHQQAMHLVGRGLNPVAPEHLAEVLGAADDLAGLTVGQREVFIGQLRPGAGQLVDLEQHLVCLHRQDHSLQAKNVVQEWSVPCTRRNLKPSADLCIVNGRHARQVEGCRCVQGAQGHCCSNEYCRASPHATLLQPPHSRMAMMCTILSAAA